MDKEVKEREIDKIVEVPKRVKGPVNIRMDEVGVPGPEEYVDKESTLPEMPLAG